MHYQPDVLLSAVYLITNHVAPAYEGVELGLGGSLLNKSLKDVSGASASELSRLWNKYGDAGDVAFEAKSTVRTLMPAAPLTLAHVYNTLVRIAGMKGQGVTQQKAALVQRLLVAAKGEEVRYLMRTFVSHLRIGAVRLTVTAALARAFCLTTTDGREGVEAAAATASSSKAQGKKRARSDDTEDSDAGSFWVPMAERTGLKVLAKTVKEGKSDPKRLAIMATLERAEALVREVRELAFSRIYCSPPTCAGLRPASKLFPHHSRPAQRRPRRPRRCRPARRRHTALAYAGRDHSRPRRRVCPCEISKGTHHPA